MAADDLPAEAAEQLLTALRELRPALGSIGLGVASKWDHTHADWHPSEHRLAGTMSEKRRADFLGGRAAVRRAMADAHVPVPPEPILIGEDGAPTMPAGVAASISHSRGIAVAVAAATEQYTSVGVDVELTGLAGGAAHLVLSAAEQAWLLDGYAGEDRDRRLLEAFSAKESACKALRNEGIDGPPRRIHLIPFGGSFIAWPRDRRAFRMRVWVRHVGPGVLTWTAIPKRERKSETSSRCATGPASVAGRAWR